MFVENKLDEVEIMLKKKREGKMRTGNFATLQGSRGIQFGREVYTTLLQFKDLREFLEVFPEVQREVSSVKVGRMKTYILSGLEEEESMRFFSAITATCRGHVFYDEVAGRIAIDNENSKLSINDGQHRFNSIAQTVDYLQRMTKNGRSAEERNRFKLLKEELEEMVIPLVIFNQISEREEKQLFADINNLASRPSRAATIRLSQTDLIAKMANQLSETNKFMLDYGVEKDKPSISDTNPNLLLLTTIYLSIRELLKGIDDKGIVRFHLTKEDFESTYVYIEETFNEVFRSLPYDIQNKNIYICHKHFSLKGIMRFIKQARQENFSEKMIFGAIKNVDWSMNIDYWGTYGATMSKKSNILLFPAGEAPVEAVKDACFIELNKIMTKGE